MQLGNFRGNNHAATTTKHLDVAGTCLSQHVDHVLEILDVSALIRGHCDAVRVFLEGCVDNLFHAAVMPEVNHLAAAALNDAAHDVDSGVVPIKQTSGSDESNLVFGPINQVFSV